jgi:hypothetical protein
LNTLASGPNPNWAPMGWQTAYDGQYAVTNWNYNARREALFGVNVSPVRGAGCNDEGGCGQTGNPLCCPISSEQFSEQSIYDCGFQSPFGYEEEITCDWYGPGQALTDSEIAEDYEASMIAAFNAYYQNQSDTATWQGYANSIIPCWTGHGFKVSPTDNNGVFQTRHQAWYGWWLKVTGYIPSGCPQPSAIDTILTALQNNESQTDWGLPAAYSYSNGQYTNGGSNGTNNHGVDIETLAAACLFYNPNLP